MGVFPPPTVSECAGSLHDLDATHPGVRTSHPAAEFAPLTTSTIAAPDSPGSTPPEFYLTDSPESVDYITTTLPHSSPVSSLFTGKKQEVSRPTKGPNAYYRATPLLLDDFSGTVAELKHVQVKSKITPWLIFVVIFASMTGLLMGYDLAVIAVVLKPVTEYFNICDGADMCRLKELFVAMIAPGALVGSALGGFLADTFGRRWAMGVRDCCVVAGCTMQAFSEHFEVMLLGRALKGCGVGIGFVAFATYVSEVSPTDIRGQMVIIQEVAQCTGVLLALVLVNITGDQAWRGIIGGAAVVAAVNLPMVFFLPESPRWYVIKRRVPRARVVMQKMLQIPEDQIEIDLQNMIRERELREKEIAAFAHAGKCGCFSRLTKSLLDLWTHRRQVLIALGVGIAQDFIATNAVLYYHTDIFRSAGICLPYYMGLGIGIMKFIDTFIVVATVEVVGRRKLLLLGTFGTLICHIVFAILFRVLEDMGLAGGPEQGVANCREGDVVVSWVSILVAINMYAFIAAWDISWAGLMFVVASEILPSSIRGIGMGISIFFFWLTLFITEVSFQSMWIAMTMAGTFGFYAGLTMIVLVFVWVFVPETKGESLEEITEKFRLKKGKKLKKRSSTIELCDAGCCEARGGEFHHQSTGGGMEKMCPNVVGRRTTDKS